MNDITHDHDYHADMYGDDVRCVRCDCRPGGRWSILSCNLIDEIAMFADRPDWQTIIGKNRNEFMCGYLDAARNEWHGYERVTHGLFSDSGVDGRVAYGLGRRTHRMRVNASLVG